MTPPRGTATQITSSTSVSTSVSADLSETNERDAFVDMTRRLLKVSKRELDALREEEAREAQ